MRHQVMRHRSQVEDVHRALRSYFYTIRYFYSINLNKLKTSHGNYITFRSP